MSDVDPQANAEQLDEDELPRDVAPDTYIPPEEWDRGAGASEGDATGDSDSDYDESQMGQEREAPVPAEEAAMHVERGIADD